MAEACAEALGSCVVAPTLPDVLGLPEPILKIDGA